MGCRGSDNSTNRLSLSLKVVFVSYVILTITRRGPIVSRQMSDEIGGWWLNVNIFFWQF